MRVVNALSELVVTAAILVTAPAASAAPPPNDDFEFAAPLGDTPVLVSGTVTDATHEAGEPYHGLQTVWYVFRPSRTARVAFKAVAGESYHVAIAHYDCSIGSEARSRIARRAGRPSTCGSRLLRGRGTTRTRRPSRSASPASSPATC